MAFERFDSGVSSCMKWSISQLNNHHHSPFVIFCNTRKQNLLIWIFKCVFLVNFLPHWQHKYGCSCVCMRKCTRNSFAVWKSRAHSEHRCGRIDECFLLCCCNILAVVNCFPQSLHLNRFSPVWIDSWLWRDFSS